MRLKLDKINESVLNKKIICTLIFLRGSMHRTICKVLYFRQVTDTRKYEPLNTQGGDFKNVVMIFGQFLANNDSLSCCID